MPHTFSALPKLSILSDCISYTPNGGDATQGQVAAWEFATGITPSCATEIRTAGEAALGIIRIVESSHPALTWPLPAGVDIRRIVFSNIAPRGSEIKKNHPNGTPFCYAQIGNCLLVSSLDPETLGLLTRFNLIGRVRVIDHQETLSRLVSRGILTKEQSELKRLTQFRSKDFVPDAVALLMKEGELPGYDFEVSPDASPAIGSLLGWDEHGNGKLNLLPEEINFSPRKKATLADGREATLHVNLSTVPTGELALTIGSQRIGAKSLVELVIGKGSARNSCPSLNYGDRCVALK